MAEQIKRGIPYGSLAEGIQHGPYPAAKQEYIDLYLRRHLDYPELEPTLSAEQKRADIESENQYDLHADSVMEALENNRISADHAYYMQEKVLRPWFIGRRNPGE
jgi:hypothetical protein